MSETSSHHTPGPWVAKIYDSLKDAKQDGLFVWASNSSLEGKVGVVWLQLPDDAITGLPGSIETTEANARLIAAAPELYALADKVARLNPDAGEIGAGMLAQIVAMARAAIAKAEGGAE